MQTINVVPLTKRQQPSLVVTVRQNDHTILAGLIAERRLEAKTLIIDAKRHDRHEALRIDAQNDGRSLWLDTQALELSLPFGVTDSYKQLPWAALAGSKRPLSPSATKLFAESIAEFVARGGYQGVLAPTHLLVDGNHDWLDQDGQVTQELHQALERRGQSTVKIIYPLVASMRTLHSKNYRARVLKSLSSLPLDHVSLRISGVGKNSGPIVVRNVIAAVRDFRPHGHLMLMERAGLVGQALYAMGLVDSVESGIASGETFDLNHRLKPSGGRRGGAYQGVFIESLGTTIDVTTAKALLASNQGKTRFACADPSCCPQGSKSMILNGRRHSLLAQQRQVNRLAALPPTQRFGYFLDSVYAPICDMLSRAGEVLDRFHEAHRRSLSIKEMLKTQMQDANKVAALHNMPRVPRPTGRVVRFPSQDNAGKNES